jgi:DNA polymerase-3 subunit gamma/tau
MMPYLIYARKYRPRTFEQMIGQKAIVQTLQNAIKANRVAQAYIFSGMRGVGKTTAARILAKALNCQHGPIPIPCNKCEFCLEIDEDRSIDVLEIDGASNRGIEEVRALRDAVKYKPLHSRYKIIYIDEVHQVTREGFNALLKTLEEPPPQTVFIFATTEFHKVPATIVSRCQHFEFKKISQKEIINHLLDIAQKEKITITPYGLKLIAEAAEGSMRDAQSLLDQAVAFSGEVIQDNDLKEILGAINKDLLFECSDLILGQKPSQVFALVEKIMEKGHDLRVFHKELIKHFRNLLLVKSVQQIEDLLPLNPEELAELRAEAEKGSAEELLRYLHVLQQAESGLRFSPHPQIYLETLLIKLCQFKKIIPLQELIDEVGRLRGERTAEPRDSGDGFTSTAEPEKKAMTPEPPSPAALSQPPTKERVRDDKEAWQKILAELQKEKSSLAAILAREAAFRLKDETADIKFSADRGFVIDNPVILEVSFPSGDAFYREALHREVKTVERIASDILGQKVKVRLEEARGGGEYKKEKGVESALKDPAVRAFMDAFRAQILSVEPVTKAKEAEEK